MGPGYFPSALGGLGYLAIDRWLGGKSCGGLRIGAGVTREEAMALSRMMSLKYGIANLWMGGAKSGLLLPAMAVAMFRQGSHHGPPAHIEVVVT